MGLSLDEKSIHVKKFTCGIDFSSHGTGILFLRAHVTVNFPVIAHVVLKFLSVWEKMNFTASFLY